MDSTKKVIEIKSKITGFKVVDGADQADKAQVVPELESVSSVGRNPVLNSKTYKIKSPAYDHAYYVTISNVTLNAETDQAREAPFEIFINTKDTVNRQWVDSTTLMLSRFFKFDVDLNIVLDELRQVVDPKGSWMGKDIRGRGGLINSMISSIADIVQYHVETTCGVPSKPELSETQKAYIESKKSEYLKNIGDQAQASSEQDDDNIEASTESASIIPGASKCNKCGEVAVIRMDNCDCCASCGSSKCS